ncbi:hypothetical protein U1Q18_033886, partial [Sarracenia purpurea var. burkii]
NLASSSPTGSNEDGETTELIRWRKQVQGKSKQLVPSRSEHGRGTTTESKASEPNKSRALESQ